MYKIIDPNRKPMEERTKGELREIKSSYSAYRGAITKHARSIFKKSGRPKVCVICGYNHHVDVAHIKDVKDFPNTAYIGDINSEQNIVGLCPNHHWEFDNGILDKNDDRILEAVLEWNANY